MSLLIAVAFAGALIQSTAAPAGATIAGQVLEDGTQAPLAGAHVTLLPSRPTPVPGPFLDRPRSSVTDRDGRYHFDELRAGRYRLMVQKAGFAPLSEPPGPEVNLEAGERRGTCERHAAEGRGDRGPRGG